MNREGISYQFVNEGPKVALNLSHCVDMKKGYEKGRGDASRSNSYAPEPLTGSSSPALPPFPKQKSNHESIAVSRALRETPMRKGKPSKRCKRGRPCKPWHQRAVYQRRFCEKRLRPHEVENLLAADQFATRTRRRLETFVTIRWAGTGKGEENIHARWLTLLNATRIWASRHNLELAHVWVHENPPRHEPAFNTHLLANIPSALRGRFTTWLMARLDALNGAVRVEARTHAAWNKPDARLAYMLKGTDKATAMKHRLISQNGWDHAQGIIHFKRCGTSANLNAKARATGLARQYAPAREGNTRFLTVDSGSQVAA